MVVKQVVLEDSLTKPWAVGGWDRMESQAEESWLQGMGIAPLQFLKEGHRDPRMNPDLLLLTRFKLWSPKYY